MLKSLINYYETFQKFLIIIIFLEDIINNSVDFDNITNDVLREFCHEKCAEFPDFEELVTKIKEMEN